MSENNNDMRQLLDDDEIRNYFAGRDPNRRKVNPFTSEETAEEFGKSSSLKSTQGTEEEETKYGISFSQHTKKVRDVARHFFFIGMIASLAISILLKIFL